MSHPTPATAVSLRDYWDQLDRHDWLYEYSDDFTWWSRANKERHYLRAIARQSPEHAALYWVMREWAHGRGEKPVQPEAEAA